MNNDKFQLTDEEVAQLEEQLEYQFEETDYLNQALTHSSLSYRNVPHNERLEFLGDSVLETVICEYLFRTFPDLPEGRLSKFRSVVVSSKSLFTVASNLGLRTYCRVSRGLLKKDKIPDSIVANMLEAVIAAIYLDGGLGAARSFILSNFEPVIRDVVQSQHTQDFKSILQQYTQKKWNKIPHYKIISEEGPDHDKHFQAIVMIRGEEYGPGEGTSKQEAEQKAARAAVNELDIDPSTLN